MYWRMYFVHAVRRACILAGAAWLCALPAAGQAIPDEGYPSKPVFPEESAAPPALHEECGAFLLAHPVTPDAFPEECTGNAAGDGNNGLDGAGNGVAGAGSSSAALDPALHTPPRLECPSAVFLEEMETGAIDCHAYDAAGEEHLDYFWEPIGHATRDYLENPRLLPEDAPNPVVVAPSFPVYDTLESFLAEEGAQRYRYRLTVTSRATGLSSHAEVEVFVRSSQPGVYCPLEIEVEEGATVVLACEGADPLSFRMDASDERGGGSPALWEWEGLWGSSTAPLAATDTPQPLFTAPVGSAGRTYHYVASLTTSSSGVPRTARRRVSVTVKADEGVAAYSITCPDYNVYPSRWDFRIECTVSPEEPSGATYDWQTQSGGDASLLGECAGDHSGCAAIPKYQPVFYGRKLTVAQQTKIKKEGMVFKYRVTMSAPGIDDVTDDFTMTFLKAPDLMDCSKTEYTVTAGVDDDFQLDCKPKLSGEDKDPLWFWSRGPESTNTPPESMNLDKPWDKQNKRYHVPEFDATFLVPDALPAGKEIEVYQYYLCMFQWAPSIPNGLPGDYRIEETEYITVTVKRKPDHDITVECLDSLYSVYAGEQEQPLTCTATGAPEGDTYTYDWKPLGTTPDTDLLSGPDIVSPTFTSPKALEKSDPQPKEYEYRLTASSENANSGSADVTVQVWKRADVALTCPGNPYSAYAGDGPLAFDCKPSNATLTNPAPNNTYTWHPWGATTDLNQISGDKTSLNPTFDVPASVAGEATYEYRVVVEPARGSGDFKDITVTVRERLDAAVVCNDPAPVYEGADPVALNCSVTTTLDASSLTYAWEAVGSPADTNPLADADGPTPTFNVPGQVAMDEMHTYRLTVSMGGMEAAPEEVIVTVLDKPQIAVACVGNPYSTYEGAEADITLDCSSPEDPDGSLYTYAWTARNAASAARDLGRLDAPNIPAPTFAVPEDVPQTTDYAYLLTVSGPDMEDGTVEVDVTVQNKAALALSCKDPAPVYEGADPIALNCTPSADPGLSDGASYAYSWASLGSASDADLLVAGAGGAPPTFQTPDDVAQTMQYEYVLTLSAANAEDATAEVTVTVLDTPQIVVACEDPDPVREGAEDITLSCEATGAPEGSAYVYAWAARNNARATPDTDLLRPTDAASPTFAVPADISETTRYEYVLTATAANAKAGSGEVTVTVLDDGAMALVCADPDPVYEGSADITLSCAATGAPEGSTYEYTWAPRGATPDTDLLSAPDVASPMFAVPAEVDADETYEYTVTATAGDLEAAPAEVSVTVLDKPQIVVACSAPDPVYEGSEDIRLDCAASMEPGGPDPAAYTYVWTAGKGASATEIVDRLIAGADGPTPTFNVPDDVPQTTQYEYTLTVTAEHAESGVAEVVVRVLDKPQIVVACAAPDPVYEGSEDITLDCAASVEPGVPDPAAYTYVWTAGKGAGAMASVDRLIAGADGPTPTFNVPDDVPQTTQYEYTLTVTAEDAEAGSTEVVVTVLDSRALVLTCANPDPVYEGSEDIALDCAATRDTRDATGDVTSSDYEYAWTALNNTGATAGTDLLSRADIASPTFFVPDDVPQTTRYEYQVTVSAEHADPAMAEVTVTVLNKAALALACAGNPYSAYEGSEDILLDCSASGEPGEPGALESSDYEYAWTPLNTTGATADTELLSATDIASPTFAVPAEVAADETYEYLLTVSAENADPATVEVSVTVLNKATLALVCAGNPYSVYEGSEDITLDCAASGVPEGSEYAYAWTGRGATADTDLLSALDIASPTFAAPDSVDADETYEYLLTVSADHADDATVEVTVTVLDRIAPPSPEPVVSSGEPPAPEPVASSADPSALGVRVSVSSLRFGVQSSDARVSLDPLSEQISTSVSGPHHAGRMMLSLDEALSLDENEAEAEALALSIELVTPVTLRRLGDNMGAPAFLSLSPSWSIAESCESLSSQAIGGWHIQTRLSESDCRLLLFGGELDLSGALPGRYAGNMDFILRTASGEETHSIEVAVDVAPTQHAMLAGAEGVRFAGPDEVSMRLTEAQNVRISPDVAYLTREAPSGAFAFSNVSLIPQEISISARFGYAEATEDGRETLVEDPSRSRLGDLSSLVDIYPRTLILMPGEEGVIRYGIREEALALMGAPSEEGLMRYGVRADTLASMGAPSEEGVIRYGIREEALALMGAPSEEGLMRYGVRADTLASMGAPSEEGLMRYGVRADTLASMGAPADTLASLTASGYAAFFEVTSAPHQYVRTDQLPEAATGGKTAHVTMRIPGAYAPDERAPSLRAELISVSEGTSPSATFLVETDAGPFFGEMVAYDGDGRELGRRQTLVYTRSRVRMPLAWMPEEEVVFLRFISYGGSSERSSKPGRVSEPVSVPWDAPQRDSRIGREIGAAPASPTSPTSPASSASPTSFALPTSPASPASPESAVFADKP